MKRRVKVTIKTEGFNSRNIARNVPSIKLSGKYLLNLGFKFGDVVEITPAGDGALDIRRANEL